MTSRTIVGALVVAAFLGAATLSARGDSYVGTDKQWTIANFVDPVLVKGQFVMGPVLIVHDSARMARGEPCTSFYRFDPGVGPKELLVSFHCRPRLAEGVATTRFTTVSTDGCRRLVEYQVAGDSEAHGVPIR
jgi:hypothetical protein